MTGTRSSLQGGEPPHATSVLAGPPAAPGSALSLRASSDVRAVLGRIRRTEDIRLSPADQRVAVVDYSGECIHVFDIDLSQAAQDGVVSLRGCCVLRSRTFRGPHGVAFLGEEHIAVSNRRAGVDILRLPAPTHEVREIDVQPMARIRAAGVFGARVKTPGSVEAIQQPHGGHRVWVCNNRWNMVSGHTVDLGPGVRIRHEGVRVERGLQLPDGISASPDGRWIAVSNHVRGEVLVYANSRALDRRSAPVAALGGIVCPHGLRFSPDGQYLLVADAASRYVHVYRASPGGWRTVAGPDASIELVDPEAFQRGRSDAREGGVKGLAFDRSGGVLAVTHRHEVLAFYDVPRLLRGASTADPVEMRHLCEVRDRFMAQELREADGPRWTLRSRVRQAVGPRRKLRKLTRRTRSVTQLAYLRLRNRCARESLLEQGGPTLSMTTHGARLHLAFYAIESIALGRRRPARMTLWLSGADFESRPGSLRRLERRGLEVRPTEDLGPHTKYYPLLCEGRALDAPLVTADDDVLYPPWWLERLIQAHARQPGVIHCHRAHRMGLGASYFTPYSTWSPCRSSTPSHLNLITGVSGAIYPVAFLRHLAQQGTLFLASCPKADDIWLTVNALRACMPVAQVGATSANFPVIPGTRRVRLSLANVVEGGNQLQLLDTFTSADRDALRRHQAAEGA